MKKIYAILAGAFLFSASASAQRLINLGVTMTSPTASSTVTAGGPITVKGVITNVGTDSVKTTDTIIYQYTINNTPVVFGQAPNTYNAFARTGKTLNQNDTVMVDHTYNLNFTSSLNGTQSFCLTVIIRNRSADSAKDNSTANNSSCVSMTFSGGTTSIEGVTGSFNNNFVTNVFPMPASTQANFDLKLGANSNVSVKITDFLGRTVITENKGMMSKGTHTVPVNTEALTQGIYIYQVIMNEEVSSGKILINK